MKFIIAVLILSLCLPAASASGGSSHSAEATTAVTLPVDYVTVYPDGLMAVKRTGGLELTEGVHSFVINLPEKADKRSVLLSVSNATSERVVYEANPIFTLNVTSPGLQRFDLSYLMRSAATWKPVYDLQLTDETASVRAQAVVTNWAGEDMENVRLKLVAGLPSAASSYARAAPSAAAPEAAGEKYAAYTADGSASASGELEALYIFELEDRVDLPAGKEIGFPLFEQDAPLVRVYTWDAASSAEGPVMEEIRANNTLTSPWPAGEALLYRNGEYISAIDMPYTASGTNASIALGPSADLKVEKKLLDYNISESIKVSQSGNHSVRETVETWSYSLNIKSNLDREASLEVRETLPREAVIVSASPQPSESLATSLKWDLDLLPRQKTAISYTFQVTSMEGLGDKY